MKRTAIILPVALLVVMAVLYFIPTIRQEQVFVASPFQNIIASLTIPHNWTKWNQDVREAWAKDPARCSFTTDSATGHSTITIPGKTIDINTHTYLLFEIQATGSSRSRFSVSLIPYIGNGQPRSQHNSYIVYTEPTNVLFKLFPSLDNKFSAPAVVDQLRRHLEDNSDFYGFPVEIKTSEDTFFVTRKFKIPAASLASSLPHFFDDIEHFALGNHSIPRTKNISITRLKGDSLEVLAGITIDQLIQGNDTFNVMRLPPGQIVAVAHYTGKFFKRPTMYEQMEKYLFDHQLVQIAAPYEKYISNLPTTDTSMINIDLTYPLRY